MSETVISTKERSKTNLSNTFDDVFQSLKANHTKLFIPLLNYKFDKDYSLDEVFELLPTDEYITNFNKSDSIPDVERKISDFIIKIRDDKYLLECQSYNDGSMALRIAEYTFLTARQDAIIENGKLTINMPLYSVIYIRSNSETPKKTEITFNFPNGETVRYDADNILLSDFTKEEIIEKKLYVLIPFYVLRYESIIKDENASETELREVQRDLDYFISFLKNAVDKSLIDGYAYENLRNYIKMIIRHVANGNINEKELMNKMGGNVIVTEADKIFWAAKDALRDQVTAEVKEELRDQVTAEVREELRDQVTAEVRDQVTAEVRDQVTAEFFDKLSEKDETIAILTKKVEELTNMIKKINI